MTVLKISKLQGFVWKTMQVWLDGISCFSKMLPIFGGRCNRYFWDIRPKILRLPNFNMLFQFVLAKLFKSERFSCSPEVDHVIKSGKEPIKFSFLAMGRSNPPLFSYTVSNRIKPIWDETASSDHGSQRIFSIIHLLHLVNANVINIQT